MLRRKLGVIQELRNVRMSGRGANVYYAALRKNGMGAQGK